MACVATCWPALPEGLACVAARWPVLPTKWWPAAKVVLRFLEIRALDSKKAIDRYLSSLSVSALSVCSPFSNNVQAFMFWGVWLLCGVCDLGFRVLRDRLFTVKCLRWKVWGVVQACNG